MERRRTTPAGPAGRRPGRPATVTRAALTDAVLRLGFPGLTVSAAARELGVRHASLYRHVTGREHLIALALDRIIAGAPWPEPTGGWRTYLAGTAGTLWDLLDAHPGLAAEMAVSAPLSPVAVERMNAFGTALLGFGFAPADAVLACDLVVDLACDVHALCERIDGPHDPGAAHAAGALAPELRAEFTAVLAADPRSWFERKLTVVLDGIAAGLAPD
ncbi:TetR/AcrR family transcriptional regulator [Nocardiopsis composta]|uniref:AcrR family transcriptional regulator n=1 Tax=Nocardiopsis composta TaxID=157465 RepID=A0A7W8QPF5_9ACTN|nr:TetR/AcrR family transcriptional regulator [Nocardiopsis composta]MBB5433458.1 AcrR family transcriptional regulator [Nocardiopsis composta]